MKKEGEEWMSRVSPGSYSAQATVVRADTRAELVEGPVWGG